MQFKLDANLGIRGKELLLEHGHDVVTAEQEGLATALDCELLQACAIEKRARPERKSEILVLSLMLVFAGAFAAGYSVAWYRRTLPR